MNIISRISPQWALKREKSRRMLAMYEATRPTATRKNPKSKGSANSVNEGAGQSLRDMARHLEENYDFASGVLDVLVRNTVGASGIGIEPAPKHIDGSLHADFADTLRTLWRDFCEHPETTQTMDWALTCQLMARTWFRDGEAFSKDITGRVPKYQHGTRVPFSLELLEPDYCPHEHGNSSTIVQGIEFNTWRQPVQYFFYDRHPGDHLYIDRLRPVQASRVNHLRSIKRLHQARGISSFASVMSRLNNIADYEKYEQVAARVAASMTGYIKKGTPDLYTPPIGNDGQPLDLERDFQLAAGAFFDDLQVGEEIGPVKSNRPSGLLSAYLKHMMRGTAAGTGAGYSSISKDYNGSYSAQRQELIEQWANYALLGNQFIGQFVKPVWHRFVDMVLLTPGIEVPGDLDLNRLYEADFLNPQMPWIDPKKEADAFKVLLELGLISPQAIIRARGQSPQNVLDQRQQWKDELKKRGLPEPQPPAAPNPAPPPPEPEEDDE